MVCGLGSEAGAAMCSHPDVRQIVFTGSVATGINIATAAAKNIVPCVLELGGKSAAIVCSDARHRQFYQLSARRYFHQFWSSLFRHVTRHCA